jgi:glutamyl-tRNA synthetase
MQLEAMSEVNETFWNSVRGNLKSIQEINEWASIIHNRPILVNVLSAGEKEFVSGTADLLPTGEWNESSWDIFIQNVKDKTDRKGKELFMPLRKALTGREHGPDMKTVFALLGRGRARERLLG